MMSKSHRPSMCVRAERQLWVEKTGEGREGDEEEEEEEEEEGKKLTIVAAAHPPSVDHGLPVE